MPKLFIHIGAHKTGTTSLQFILNSKREELLDKDGVYYSAACQFHYAQHRLAFAMKGMEDPIKKDIPNLDSEIEDFICDISSVEKDLKYVILSSEEFFTAPSDAVKYFLNKVRKFFDDIEICAVIRRHDNQFLSIYNQKVKSPSNGFFRPVSFYLNNPALLDDELFYGKNLKSWLDLLVDKEKITVFQYEKFDDTAKGLINYIVGREVTDRDSVKINRSYSVKHLELLRHLKSQIKDAELIAELSKKASVFFNPEENESMLSYDERSNILGFFEKDNESLDFFFANEEVYGRKTLLNDKSCVKTRLLVNDVVSFFIRYGVFDK